MSSAFIPVFTEYQTLKIQTGRLGTGERGLHHTAHDCDRYHDPRNHPASGSSGCLAPGFHDDPAKLGMTTLLTRIMFPYLFLSASPHWQWAS